VNANAEDASARGASARHVLLLACATLSGAAALVYQVVWNRELLIVFGSTTSAVAAVVAAFMGGMALGSAALARYGGAVRRPARLYAGLELAIALYALAFPFLLAGIGDFYAGTWEVFVGKPVALAGIRLLLGLLLLGVPTIIMGATLPLLAHALALGAASYRVASWLYGLNAFGGAVGAAACGFWLLPKFGAHAASLAGVGLNLAVALVAGVVDRRRSGSRCGAARQPVITPTDGERQRSALIPLALALAGFAAMAYEVVWTRMLVLVNGSSTYAFSLLLSVYISGLALGSLWMASRVDRLRSASLSFAHLQAGVAVMVAAGLWLFGRMPGMSLDWYASAGFSFLSTLVLSAGLTALMVLPPAFLLGAAFPVAVRMLGAGQTRLYRPFGHAYAWTAAGNVAGAVAAGAGMIAWFGLQGSLRLLAATSMAAAALALFAVFGLSKTTTVNLAALGVLLAGLLWWNPGWDPLVLTSGVYKQAPLYLGLGGRGRSLGNVLSNYRLRYYREGEQAVVSVVDRPNLQDSTHRILAIDGKVDASSGADMDTQVLSGHLPLLLHGAAREVLIIGLASGVTVGAVARHSRVARISVAEIEPAVVGAARQFAAFNHDALDDPRVRLVLDDGRHFLRVSAERFDVIIAEPSNPWMSGPARLFTREFFEEVRAHLAGGGVFAQWMPLYGVSTALLQAELRTFLRVFPYVELCQVAKGDLLLVGSGAPITRPDMAALAPQVVSDLRRIGIDGAALAARFVTGEQGLAEWLADGPVNTDDNGLLEFGAPRFLLTDRLAANQRALDEAPWRTDFTRWFGVHEPGSAISGDERLRVARAYLARERHQQAQFLARTVAGGEAAEVLGDIQARRGAVQRARELWQDAGTPGAAVKLAELALDSGNGLQAIRYLDAVPVAARVVRNHYLRSLAYARLGQLARAVTEMARVSPASTSGWQILAPYISTIVLRRGDPSAGATAAQFHTLLDELRGELERERGQSVLDELLKEIERVNRLLLTDEERRQLLRMVEARVVAPLAVYYRGVSQLWLGDYAVAGACFESYLDMLPGTGVRSRAYALLQQARAAVKPAGTVRAAKCKTKDGVGMRFAK